MPQPAMTTADEALIAGRISRMEETLAPDKNEAVAAQVPRQLLGLLAMALGTLALMGTPGVPAATGAASPVGPVQSARPLFLPAALRQHARSPSTPRAAGDLPVAMAAEGELLFLAYRSRVEIVDWSDVLHPRRLSRLSLADSLATCHISVRGGLLALVLGRECGPPGGSAAWVLRLGVVATPATPRWAGQVDFSGGLSGLAVGDGFAYLALDGIGMTVVDIRDPDQPRLGASVTIASGRLAMGSSYLFGAAGTNGVLVFDLADPARPALRTADDGQGTPWLGYTSALVPAGHYVAVGGGFSRIAWVGIWDVADAIRPQSVVTVDQHLDPVENDVAWGGSRLFIGHADAVAAYDMVDVARPLPLGSVTVPEGVLALASVADHGLALTRAGSVVAIEAPVGSPPRRIAEYRAPE